MTTKGRISNHFHWWWNVTSNITSLPFCSGFTRCSVMAAL